MPPAPASELLGSAHSGAHLIVPYAVCNSPAWLKTVASMPPASTRQTQALLRSMRLETANLQSEHSLSPPHERALAQALGLGAGELEDGLIPWAALDAQRGLPQARVGQGWAWVTPCHWAMGREQATLTDPAALDLAESESRTLLAAMAPYFDTDGIRLHYGRPDRWLAEGEMFRSLPTASLDRVLGRNVDPWLPGDKTLTRLQNEMQMLLYTHPANETRSAARQWPVNSFWLSGTGTLTQPPSPSPSPSPTAPDLAHRGDPSGRHSEAMTSATGQPLALTRTLAEAVFRDDWVGYAEAWAAVVAGPVSDLLARQRAGLGVRLTLCGERGFETWRSG
ncbi:MAG: hypothetical protein LH479_07940, partial [Polaromonas sp.]|nr:hypothetical protein [Polaromonas sp.]